MPGNSGRDSLDDWLEREVRPLPPPSGTFEMITKRARRRKMRKLAISVTSAAAVAAAVVVAVPAVLSLHLNTSSANGVTAGHTLTPSAAAPAPNALTSTPAQAATSPMGSQAPGPTTSLGVTPAIAMPPGGPVPANFQPTSVTFVSASEGWAIGQAGTPGQCSNADPAICTSLVRTNDRGRTWVGVPAPSTSRVGSIRFLDGINGWAFGPDLWSTHDRGNTWTQVDTGGQQVASLETSGDKAFAVFTACKVVASTQACTATLEETLAGADTWSPVGPATTGLEFPAGGGMRSAVVTLGGGRGWLVGPAGTLYSGSIDGGPWQQAGTSPCGMQTHLGWVKSTGALVTACGSQSGTAQQPTVTNTIYTSGDGGQTWSAGSARPSTGVVQSFSASPSAPFILATSTGIDVRTSTGADTQVVSLAKGFAYVGMTGNNQGVAIPGNPLLHEIFMTYDGGLTWTPVTIIP
jgi:hypothetical protein